MSEIQSDNPPLTSNSPEAQSIIFPITQPFSFKTVDINIENPYVIINITEVNDYGWIVINGLCVASTNNNIKYPADLKRGENAISVSLTNISGATSIKASVSFYDGGHSKIREYGIDWADNRTSGAGAPGRSALTAQYTWLIKCGS